MLWCKQRVVCEGSLQPGLWQPLATETGCLPLTTTPLTVAGLSSAKRWKPQASVSNLPQAPAHRGAGTRQCRVLVWRGFGVRRLQVVGLSTNLNFLRSAVNHEAFAAGGVDTSFLEVRA